MFPFSVEKKVAFIIPSDKRYFPIAPFANFLANGMFPASYGTLQPVWIAVRPEILRDESDAINFLVRKDYQSDYLEAADFINAGYGDVVIVQYDFLLFEKESGSYLADSLRRIDVPVICSLHKVSEDLSGHDYQNLMDIWDVSTKLVVTHKDDYEILKACCGVSLDKLEYVALNRHEDPYDQEINWIYVGRQYWRLVDEQLNKTAGDLRSLQAAKDRTFLYGQ